MVVILNPGDRMRLEAVNKNEKSNTLTGILNALEPVRDGGIHHFAEVEDRVFYSATVILKHLAGITSGIYYRFRELGRLQSTYFDQEFKKYEEELLNERTFQSSWPS